MDSLADRLARVDAELEELGKSQEEIEDVLERYGSADTSDLEAVDAELEALSDGRVFATGSAGPTLESPIEMDEEVDATEPEATPAMAAEPEGPAGGEAAVPALQSPDSDSVDATVPEQAMPSFETDPVPDSVTEIGLGPESETAQPFDARAALASAMDSELPPDGMGAEAAERRVLDETAGLDDEDATEDESVAREEPEPRGGAVNFDMQAALASAMDSDFPTMESSPPGSTEHDLASPVSARLGTGAISTELNAETTSVSFPPPAPGEERDKQDVLSLDELDDDPGSDDSLPLSLDPSAAGRGEPELGGRNPAEVTKALSVQDVGASLSEEDSPASAPPPAETTPDYPAETPTVMDSEGLDGALDDFLSVSTDGGSEDDFEMLVDDDIMEAVDDVDDDESELTISEPMDHPASTEEEQPLGTPALRTTEDAPAAVTIEDGPDGPPTTEFATTDTTAEADEDDENKRPSFFKKLFGRS